MNVLPEHTEKKMGYHISDSGGFKHLTGHSPEQLFLNSA